MNANNGHTGVSGVDALKGALAGAIGVWVMDRVTWAMYKGPDPVSESAEAYYQEKAAQVEGRYAAQAAVAKGSRAMGANLSEEQIYNSGQVVHYLMGVVPGAVYGALRHQVPAVRAGRGLLYGAALFVLMDEITAPLTGITSGPTKYPWQAHARGLVGHLVLGAMTETVLGALDEMVPAPSEPPRSRPRHAEPVREALEAAETY